MRSAVVLLALFTALAAVPRTDYVNVKKKFQAIEKLQPQPGSRIPILARELNAYVENELPKVAPNGVRNPRVELIGNNMATGRAVINFLKLRSASGKPPGWIMRQILDGEHEVAVTALVESGGGKATVFLKRVEVGGVPIEGGALDYLIKNYLIPNYPDAKIGQPFELNYRMDRFEVKPGAVDIVMASR